MPYSNFLSAPLRGLLPCCSCLHTNPQRRTLKGQKWAAPARFSSSVREPSSSLIGCVSCEAIEVNTQLKYDFWLCIGSLEEKIGKFLIISEIDSCLTFGKKEKENPGQRWSHCVSRRHSCAQFLPIKALTSVYLELWKSQKVLEMAASANSVLKAVECSICFDVIKIPRLLKCFHS